MEEQNLRRKPWFNPQDIFRFKLKFSIDNSLTISLDFGFFNYLYIINIFLEAILSSLLYNNILQFWVGFKPLMFFTINSIQFVKAPSSPLMFQGLQMRKNGYFLSVQLLQGWLSRSLHTQ